MKKVDLLLINPPFHRRSGSGSIFPLGLGYIMSYIEKSGFSYEVIDCSRFISSFEECELSKLTVLLQNEVSQYDPTLVGIGPCITTQIRALIVIAQVCLQTFDREQIFAGGPFTSIGNQENFFFDRLGLAYVVKGDGEFAIAEALRHKKSGLPLTSCSTVSSKGNLVYNIINDIDSLPYPIRPSLESTLISIRRSTEEKLTTSMITSRGCVYSCRYCVSGNLQYQKFRKRSVNNIVSEMEYVLNRYGVTDIIFYDDCFFYRKEHLHEDILEFCSAIKQKGLEMTWQIEMRCDLFILLSETDIKLLDSAGCRLINLGVEKTSIHALRYLGKNYDIGFLPEQIKIIHQNSDIKVAGTFILGGRNETSGSIKELIADSTIMGLDYAHYNPLFVYPGTPIYSEIYYDEHSWVDDILNDKYPWGEIVYKNDSLSRENLLDLVDSAYHSFYMGSQLEDSMMVQDRFNLRRRTKHDNIR